jgi:hypothetical protein
MNQVVTVTGDGLLPLLGLRSSDLPVESALRLLAHGMEPELDPEDEEKLVDWVTVNEIGLELGFEDEAYVRADNPETRRRGPLLLTQLYFYGDTPRTQPFPYPLPLGLTFEDSRDDVRRKMAVHDGRHRYYIRDAWELPKFNVAAAYQKDSGTLESVLCYLRYDSWPDIPGEAELVASFTPEFFIGFFGARWSNEAVRIALAPLGYETTLPSVRAEHVADFRYSHGIELMFSVSRELKDADQRFAHALAFSGVTYYASRQLDARQWVGPLPYDLTFEDSQNDLYEKIGRKPMAFSDETFSGRAEWNFERFTLTVLYSNVQNRIARVLLQAPRVKAP